MILALTILLAAGAAYLAFSGWLKLSRRLTFHQALLYAPLKLLYRIDDTSLIQVGKANAPVIYVISHQSRLDPALMLALLPSGTLHILDEESAKSMWLEPWRELGRTITFNTGHLFVSRRLVRQLKGRSRLAVYLPPISDETSRRQLSLYRAVARIAGRGDASVVVIHVHGYRKRNPSVVRADAVHLGLFPKLRITALPPVKLPDLTASSHEEDSTPSEVLSQRARQAADFRKAA